MAKLNTAFLIIGLVKGLNEVLKALDRKQALIAVLAADCEDAKYKKFVTVSSFRCIDTPICTGYGQGCQHPSD